MPKRPSSGAFHLGVRGDLHVHWLGRDDNGQDLGYAAIPEHPGGGRHPEYCARCRLEERAKLRTPTAPIEAQRPSRLDETVREIPLPPIDECRDCTCWQRDGTKFVCSCPCHD